MADPGAGDVHVNVPLTSGGTMPSPGKDEERKAFLDRCMGDAEAVADFPKGPQRFAFCVSQWEIVGKDEDGPCIQGEVVKLDKERRVAYGWFSVIEEDGEAIVDAQGDVIKEGVLLDAVHEFAVDSRAGRILHRGHRIADIVESIMLTKDVQDALGIDLGRVGWFGAMKFRDDETWARVKSGELQAFSIGGTGARIPIK